MTEDPESFSLPSTGFLLEYDGQIYEVQNVALHVGLQKDPLGKENHTLDVRIQGAWIEEGYADGMEGLL